MKNICTAAIFCLLTPLGFAQNDLSKTPPTFFTTITPIFSQLVMLPIPKGFEPAFTDAKENSYMSEFVLAGETLKKWSQMISLIGYRGLASNPNASPKAVAERISNGFRVVCPSSFNSVGPGDQKIDGYNAFITVTSCGTNPIENQSESTLIIVLKGEKDVYVIQWAERGKASDTPLNFDQQKWVGRLQMLSPIKLCQRAQDEQAPYPSCLIRK
jgi:hypothetical protein